MQEPTKIFVTGAARSGKSRFAQAAAEALPAPRVFVATARALDNEMQQRIARHRADRGPDWETCEVPLDLPAAIHTHAPRAGVLLIDCVTLWISNLLLEHGPTAVDQGVAQLCSAVEHAPSHLVIVSNEVGAGIVPDNPLARRFRDLTGQANQRLAAACPNAYLIAAGLTLTLKHNGRPSCPCPWHQP